MTSDLKSQNKFSSTLLKWLSMLFSFFVVLCGIALALICTSTERFTQPIAGSLYFLGSTLVLIAINYFLWKRSYRTADETQHNLLVKISLSDTIIKWIVTIFSLFIAFDGVILSFMCISSASGRVADPKAAALFYLGSAIILGCFIYVVWKNR